MRESWYTLYGDYRCHKEIHKIFIYFFTFIYFFFKFLFFFILKIILFENKSM
jgi:hypothetical protein